MSHKTESLVGKTFEKCRLVAKLGTGGMGSVYLAEHAGLGRKVAVKILPADMCRDPEYVARFRREATTASRMEHPNIVQIFDVGQADGRYFIVMQYIDGESLSTVVENLGAMDPRDAARVAAGLFRGLHHAHEHGIVHRDVKPDNILVAKGDEPKILDFGLAIEQEASLQITKDGLVVGTPYYLSPEQARGHKATPLSDVYAAGVTLYYLLTGKRPFTGATALAVLNKHIHEPPVPPAAENPKVPRTLSDIVLKAMAKDPKDRYPSAAAAAEDLDRFLAGRPVAVKLPWRSRLPALTPRRKLALGGAGAGLLLLLILAVASSGDPPPPPPPPPPEAAAPPAPAPPSADPALLSLLQSQKDGMKDFAAWPRILAQYDDFLTVARAADVLTLAQQRRDECVAEMKRTAAAELARLRRDAGADPVAQLRALEEFPRPLQTLEELGELRRSIREERERLQERLDVRYLEDEAALDRHRTAGDLAAARDLVREMLRYSEWLAHAREPRLQRLKRLDETELPQLERDAADRLVQAYVSIRGRVDAALLRRDHASAYAEAVRFLKESRDPQVRVPGANYDFLLSVVPDALLSDRQLGDARLELGTALSGAPDELPFRILTDLQDAIDLEWLLRQTAAGLRRLAREPQELRLETFGVSGRVTFGPRGYELRPKSGPSKGVVVRELHPADLVTFAAAAEGKTAADALRNDGSLARSGGVAYLHSKVPERWVRAEALLREGERLRRAAPLFRLQKIRDLGHREAREALARARADAAQNRLDAARQAMLDLAAQWTHDAELSLEIAQSLSVILGAELKRAQAKGDWARVKTIARQLLQSHPSQYDSPAVLAAYGQALRSTGAWQTLAADLSGDAWTWDGRSGGAPAPAREDRATGGGLRLGAGRSIRVNPARAAGATGLVAQARVNGTDKAWSAGLFFDHDGKDGRARELVVRAPGELVLLSSSPAGEEAERIVPLDSRPASGAWLTLAWIAEAGDLVCYVDGRPVLALRAAVAPERGLGLSASVDANFRSIEIRK